MIEKTPGLAITPLTLQAYSRLKEFFGPGMDLKLELVPQLEGIDCPESHDELWSHLGRKTVLIRVEAQDLGVASLVITRRSGQTTADALRYGIMAGSGYEDLCDIFYAWKCPCNNYHVTYPTIEDLPDEVGYHDSCPRCGAAPLEVTR